MMSKQLNRSTSKLLQTITDLFQARKLSSPLGLMFITIGGIVLAEVIAMLFVYFVRHWSYPKQIILDAAIMAVIIYPILYYLSFKPLLREIQQRYQSESILQARLRLMQYASSHSLEELLQFTLDKTENLTGSTISFFHFLDPDQKTVQLQAWSTNTRRNMCLAEIEDGHYDIEQAGVWADAIRQRQPTIHNDYAKLPDRKGLPEGHTLLVRELVVPVLRDKNVMAVFGLGNKSQEYTANDVEIVSIFADFAWDAIQQKRAENALRQSEEKFRTLANWTYDWELWLGPLGEVVYTSPSCEGITGYKAEEFVADPNLLIRIVHPDEQKTYEDHHKLVHDELAGLSSIEYCIISSDGSEHWIEHLCRPLFSPDNHYLGRRISNREITQRKQAERKVIEQQKKEALLTKTIQTIQTNIARDLHDTVGQNISFIRMNLDHLSEAQWNNPTDIKTQIQKVKIVANESYELIRAMLAILQSADLNDPLSLFARYSDQIAERSRIKIDITSQGDPKQLSPQQIRQLFYIFREALSNIEKYASAERASGVFLWDNNSLIFTISDNGRGFDPNIVQTQNHYGLKFMRQRAELLKGSFSIESVPDQGTKIMVVVPYGDGSIDQFNKHD